MSQPRPLQILGILLGLAASWTVAVASVCANDNVAVQEWAAPPAAVCPGYWIVSSRCCPQDWKDGAPCCPLNYYYVGPDRQVRPISPGAFTGMLQPGVPVCIVTHGSLVSWDDLMIESPRVYQWLKCAAPGRPLQVVFFTWPSSDLPLGFCPQIDFGILGRRAEYNGLYLAQLVTQVPSACPLSFFGHSYGTRAIAATLHLFGGGDVLGYRLNHSCGIGHRVRAVFAASAIDHHWLNPGDRFGRALSQTEALLVTLNERDLALHFYDIRSLWGHTALGDEGFHRSDLRAIGWQAAKVSTLDVAPLLGCGHTWYHFYTHPQIAWSIAPWIFMGEPGMPATSIPAEGHPGTMPPAMPQQASPPVETVPPLDFE